MKTRKLPVRQCLGCRGHFDKINLIRVVKNKQLEINLDFSGKMQGRGAYICKNQTCLNKAIKSRAISRAFSMQIPDEIYAGLQSQMECETDE